MSVPPVESSGVVPATGANAVVPFQSRDELRKQRELEEARKSGLLPAEKDEEGRDINPHIPQYIAKAPWYLSQDHPSLKHQRFKEENKISIEKWYKRGVIPSSRPVKFRAGACSNCGAITHKSKECTERPRKLGAKWTKTDMQPDEIVSTNCDLDWDGKRDRWGGYDTGSYGGVVRDFELAEVERKRRKQNELQDLLRDAKSRRKKRKLRQRLSKLKESAADEAEGDDADSDSDSGTDSDSDSDSDMAGGGSDDEDARLRDFDQQNVVVGTKDDRTRTTTRNLRIREDTAKYLHNLDLESAFYDPKTRSMRDNPVKHLKDDEQGIFRGDNIQRHTGDAVGVANMELFAWEAYKHGSSVHFQSMPTQLEFVHKQHLGKKNDIVEGKKGALVKKYGGNEHMGASKDVLFSQTETYVEYAKDGTRLMPEKRNFAVSKYDEDVLLGGHTAVWGSWYDMESNRWGFRCCRQSSKTAECSVAAAQPGGGAETAACAGVASSAITV